MTGWIFAAAVLLAGAVTFALMQAASDRRERDQ